MNKLLSVSFFLIITLSLQAQTGYREEIIVSTDRELYLAGEKIWFHAVASAGPDEELLSKVLYLELYDQQFNSVATEKYRITDKLATGYIEIPASVNTGNYLLRAYTHYSRNFHPQTQTTLLVSIVNPQLPVSETEIRENNQVLVEPEGTSLIAGIKSKLAIRLIPYKGVEHNEIILLGNNAIKASCKPFSNGIALLEFTPVLGEQYELIVKKQDGSEIKKRLEVIDGQLSCKPFLVGNTLKITWNTAVANQLIGYRMKVITHGGEILMDKLIDNTETIELPLNNYQDKLAYCILQKGNDILRVHAVFTGRPFAKAIPIQMDSAFSSRKEVSMQYKHPEHFDGNIHVSVVFSESKNTRSDQIPWYTAYNSAFFKGTLHRLTQLDTSLQKQIDALMILYAGFLKNTGVHNRETSPSLQYLPEIRDAQISGSVIYKNSRLPAKNVYVYCSVLDSGNQVHIYKTGAEGRFVFTLHHLTPIDHTVYLSPQAADSTELLIDSDFDTRYPESAGYIPFLPDSSELAGLNRIFRNSQLNQIFKEFSLQQRENVYYYPVPSSDIAQNIKLTDFIEMPVMEEVFSEIVPFTAVRKRADGYYLQLYDERTRTSLDDPLMMIDGIPFFDMNQFMTVAPDLVQNITMTNRLIHLGDYTLNGIVHVKTVTENFAGLKLPAASRFINFMGINEQISLVFPQHKLSETNRIPDFRTLLYWDPDVKPGEIIKFFTSDAKGEYIVTITATDGTDQYIGTTSFRVE